MAEIGKYRRVGVIREGYQIRSIDGFWLDVTRALHFTAPLHYTLLSWRYTRQVPQAGESTYAAHDQLFCRTPAEVRLAAERRGVPS